MTNRFQAFTDTLGRAVAVCYIPERGIYCEVSKDKSERTYKIDAQYQRGGRSYGWVMRHSDGATAFGVADAFVSMELASIVEG